MVTRSGDTIFRFLFSLSAAIASVTVNYSCYCFLRVCNGRVLDGFGSSYGFYFTNVTEILRLFISITELLPVCDGNAEFVCKCDRAVC